MPPKHSRNELVISKASDALSSQMNGLSILQNFFGGDSSSSTKMTIEKRHADGKVEKQMISRKVEGLPSIQAVVLVDMSGSMSSAVEGTSNTRYKLVLECLSSMYNTPAVGKAVKRLTVFKFNSKVEFVLSADMKRLDIPRLVESLGAPSGGTALYDGIIEGLDSILKYKDKHPKDIRHLVVFTDGDESGCSKNDLEAIRRKIQSVVDQVTLRITIIAAGSSSNALETIKKNAKKGVVNLILVKTGDFDIRKAFNLLEKEIIEMQTVVTQRIEREI